MLKFREYDCYFNLGVNYKFGLADTAKADYYFLKALEINPESIEALGLLTNPNSF